MHMPPSLLTQTDLFLCSLEGEVTEVNDHIVACRPANPGYRWGNFLQLEGPPEAEELDALCAAFRDHFAPHPEIGHTTLRWDGEALSNAAAERALAIGFVQEGGLEMVADRMEIVPSKDLNVRALDPVRDCEAMVALNIDCDASWTEASEDYRQFRERMRSAWWTWHRAGAARWWGAFLDNVLVGQCGMVRCPDGLGRFQEVETHPAHRRRGVCATLVSTVGRHALDRGCRAVLLGADPEGPALGLYTRLGFRPGALQHGLILADSEVQIRLERPADWAEVASITTAAFGQPEEAALVDALRGEPEVLSLVAERDGTLLGHALFSPVEGHDANGGNRRGIALGPIAVRPSQQGVGIGSLLIRDGLQRCRDAGWTAAFVLGSPGYYGRFGWRSAETWGLQCVWPVPSGIFQATELVPGGLAGWTGRVHYHTAFDDVS